MYLKNIKLRQFKNYREAELALSPDVNCFFGLNGAGKTNLLDAIHYLCLTKSAFNQVDLNQIYHDNDFFALSGTIVSGEREHEVRCTFERGKKKHIILDGKIHARLSDHIGIFPIVLITPDDTALIREGSEERRKFFDSMISQIDKEYLGNLIRYHHFLKQRNALLKVFYEGGRKDAALLEPYNREIISLSAKIYTRRNEFTEAFMPRAVRHYKELSEEAEEVGIHYRSEVGEPDFERTFRQQIDKDVALKRTQSGIHRDDFVFEINGYPLKKFGSQGQQKSFVIALKLAQFDLIKEAKQVTPILLLDDIFDKLDDIRIMRLLSMVSESGFGQLFITDARPERSKQLLSNLSLSANYMLIDQGQVKYPHSEH